MTSRLRGAGGDGMGGRRVISNGPRLEMSVRTMSPDAIAMADCAAKDVEFMILSDEQRLLMETACSFCAQQVR
ncbi:MAG: hypothetical protein ABI574_18905 [Burkholderiales bacterium]